MTQNEINQVAKTLKEFEPGFLPYPIFEQIARLVALPILEIIPLRRNRDGQVEVLLIERDISDTHFPGTVHTPGTVIRATDNNPGRGPWQPLKRLLEDEMQNTEVGPIHYIGSTLHASKRGVEQAQLYWVEVTDKVKNGTFYPVQNLPSNIIESQIDFIKLAAKKFLEFKAD